MIINCIGYNVSGLIGFKYIFIPVERSGHFFTMSSCEAVVVDQVIVPAVKAAPKKRAPKKIPIALTPAKVSVVVTPEVEVDAIVDVAVAVPEVDAVVVVPVAKAKPFKAKVVISPFLKNVKKAVVFLKKTPDGNIAEHYQTIMAALTMAFVQPVATPLME